MPRTKRSESSHTPSLQRFALEDLAVFTKEGMFSRSASRDFHLFYVGRDDVHGILKYLLSRATSSLYLNMFGYDDDELNAECMRCAVDRSITTVITLDKSQAAGRPRSSASGGSLRSTRRSPSSRSVQMSRVKMQTRCKRRFRAVPRCRGKWRKHREKRHIATVADPVGAVRNQVYRKVPGVRIPFSPPTKTSTCGSRAMRSGMSAQAACRDRRSQ
jgi:hypothetical protein